MAHILPLTLHSSTDTDTLRVCPGHDSILRGSRFDGSGHESSACCFDVLRILQLIVQSNAAPITAGMPLRSRQTTASERVCRRLGMVHVLQLMLRPHPGESW